MPLTIPPAVNYQSPLIAVPSTMQDQPVEGRKQISCEIDWGNMGGASKCVSFNLQNNATLNLSQISTLKIDNSHSSADATFIFPDTGETIDIPAGTPLAIVPVLSNALAFFVYAPSASSGDFTRFTMLNYPISPTNVPATFEGQTFVISSSLGLGGGSSNPFIALGAGKRGVLQNLQVAAEVNTTTAAMFECNINLADGGSPAVNYGDWRMSCPPNSTQLGPPINLTGVEISFSAGVTLTYSLISAAGTMAGRLNILATYLKQ